MDKINKNDEKQLEHLGAFEISNKMLSLAQKNEKNNIFLNAGRGNPNWINKKARLAFTRIVEFGVLESERTMKDGDLAGYTEKDGIRERFETFLDPDKNETDQFLMNVLSYIKDELHLDRDEVVKEFVDGVIGNNYPVPSRILKNSETIINHYLQSVLYHGEDLENETQLFPTEGGTAAIVYIFNSLKENKLIKPGDKIALNTPIFTPYIQVPALNDYEMVEIDLGSKEENNWEVSPKEIDKLQDPDIKAFFIVNPSNPGSKAFDQKALNEIKKAVAKNPNLMIITDDVYGTFVDDFQTVYSVAPKNTLLVYSYSKLFGATGWRLGVIGVSKDNVFDKLIAALPQADKQALEKRYSLVVLEPEKMKFIDRMVADSRSIGLYHTSGLSTPQQIMEVLFSLTHLVEKTKNDPYIAASNKLIDKRYDDLHKALTYPEDNSETSAKYYSIIDIYELAEKRHGKAFREYLADNFEQVDFLLKLAEKNGVVLMDGVGFNAAPGDLRVSEANLPTEDYRLIGRQVLELLDEYYKTFEAQK